MPIQSVTVYCSSSANIHHQYFEAAAALGRAIAAQNWTLIYGGNALGTMKTVADAVRYGGGTVVGITTQQLHDEGVSDLLCHELHICATMRERKALLEERGDAFIVLPGGLGTLEEFSEVLVSRLLRVHDKPLVLLNINNYFAPLLRLLEHGIEEQFIKPGALELFHVATSVEQAIQMVRGPEISSDVAVEESSAAE